MKKIKVIIPIILFILLLITGYRYFYGGWNPFISPDRIECYGRRYYISHNSIKTFSSNKKSLYQIKSLNILTGKKLYSEFPKGEIVPTVILLDIGNDKYQTYTLSGGP